MAIKEEKRYDKCTVILTTMGGDPGAGFRIARCLRHHYKNIRLVIPSFCKSAGTLVAIGADELVIGDLGELGPLDIQVSKASELAERSSGLDIIQALEVVQGQVRMAFHNTLLEIRKGSRLSTKLAGEMAASVAIGVAAPLYSQIDPNRLGEMQRAMSIAHEYGLRLNASSKILKEGMLDALVANYPSHSFVIDRKEASELFNNVESPTSAENDFCHAFWQEVLGKETDQGPFFVRKPDDSQGGTHDGISEGIDSAENPNSQTRSDNATNSPSTDDQSERVRTHGVSTPDSNGGETQIA
jgi:hypothetical protein